jgi:hypothetical protein
MREMSGLRAGREAQEMATLISADDQTAAPTPSRVVSGEMEISYRLLRRTMLVMQTLGWVLVLEGFDDGLRLYSQAAEGEDEHEADLLVAWQLQLLQERHGERKHHDVCGNVQGGVGEPECQLVHAVTVNGLVPEVSHGDAHKERTTKRPDAVNGEYADHDVAQALDPTPGKDSDVLEDDGNLGEYQGQVIHRDGAP